MNINNNMAVNNMKPAFGNNAPKVAKFAARNMAPQMQAAMENANNMNGIMLNAPTEDAISFSGNAKFSGCCK